MLALPTLNPAQNQAVFSKHLVNLVVASAGTGKTRVLIARYLHLLNNQVNPSQIVAITFTEKAASEMKERISQSLAKAGDDIKLPANTIGTIHSFLSSLLRQYALKLGLREDYQILSAPLDRFLKKQFIQKAIKQAKQPKLDELLYEYGYQKLCEIVLAIIDEPWFILERLFPTQKTADFLLEFANKIHEQIIDQRIEQNQLAFNDLEFLGLKLLQNKKINKEIADRSPYLLVDEFQDLNPIQMALIQEMWIKNSKPLFLVGDPKQSIYRFRGASHEELRVFLELLKTKDFKAFALDTTHRLSSNLCNALNPFFELLFYDEPSAFYSPMTGNQKSNQPGLELIVVDKKLKAQKSRAFEAEQIVNLIHEVFNSEPTAKIGVLIKNRTGFSFFEDQLKKNGIEVYQKKRLNLMKVPLIQSLICFVQYLLGDQRPLILLGMLKAPWLNLSLSFLDSFYKTKPKKLTDFNPGLFCSPQDQKSWQTILHFCSAIPKDHDWQLSNALHFVLDIFAIHPLDIKTSLDRRSRHLIHLLTQSFEDLDKWQNSDQKQLDYLKEFSSQKLEIDFDEKPSSQNSKPKVEMLTIHQAKGLEYDYIFLPQLYARSNHAGAPYFFDSQAGLKRSKRLIQPGLKRQFTKPEIFAELEEKNKQEEMSEKKRLVYVALTRAKKQVCVFIPEAAKKQKKPWHQEATINKWLNGLREVVVSEI